MNDSNVNKEKASQEEKPKSQVDETKSSTDDKALKGSAEKPESLSETLERQKLEQQDKEKADKAKSPKSELTEKTVREVKAAGGSGVDNEKPYTKVFYIRRKNMNTKVPEFIHREASKKLSASWVKGGDILRGLTPEEEVLFMPKVIGVAPNSANFEDKCREYWCNISIPVEPGEGTALTIRFDPTKGKVPSSISHMPVLETQNLVNYIKLRFAFANKRCANTQEALHVNRAAIFFLYDPIKDMHEKEKQALSKRDAMKIYIRVSDNSEIRDQILAVLDHDTEILNESERNTVLQTEFEKNPEHFVAIAEDEDLSMKYFVNKLAKHQIVSKIENDFVDGSKNWGNTKRFIAALRDPINSDKLQVYRSKLEQIVRKPVEVAGVAYDAPDMTENPFL